MEILVQRLQEKPEQVPDLESELEKIRKEVNRFVDMIAKGNAPDSILTAIKERETQISHLEQELAEYQSLTPDVSEFEIKKFRKQATEQIEKFDDLLTGNVARARQAMRKLMRDEKGGFVPLSISPVTIGGRKTLAFKGQIFASQIFNNIGAEERT